MAATIAMKMKVGSAGPETSYEIGEIVEFELSAAAREWKASHAEPVNEADKPKLAGQFKQDNKPLGRHEAHKLPKPDHGPVCPCHFCK